MKPKIGLKIELKSCKEEDLTARITGDRSKLPAIFERFLSLEREAKLVNRRKAELISKAKDDGFDRRALQAAFRHRMREIDKPDATANHDQLTEDYLIALRGSDRDGAHPGSLQVEQLIAPAPADAITEPHVRPRARARTHEAIETQDSGSVHSNDPDAISSAVNKMPIMEEEPDIPECLDARKQSKQPILANDGGK